MKITVSSSEVSLNCLKILFHDIFNFESIFVFSINSPLTHELEFVSVSIGEIGGLGTIILSS